MNLRLIGTGRVERPAVRRLERGADAPARAIKGRRRVYFSEPAEAIEVDTYDRERLRAGDVLAGPTIIEQMDTTIVIPPAARVEVEDQGNLVISIAGDDRP